MPRQWPNVVTLSDGRAVLLWVEDATEGYRLMSAIRSAGGTWGNAEVVLEKWELIDHPRVAVTATDQVQVVFHAHNVNRGKGG